MCLGQRGNYTLRDLKSRAEHPNMHVSRLRRYAAQTDERPLDADEYLVESLLQHRWDQGKGRWFLVKWVGYPKSQATWEPEGSLKDRCQELIDEYDKAHPPRSGTEPGPKDTGEATANKEMESEPERATAREGPTGTEDRVAEAARIQAAKFERGEWFYLEVGEGRGRRLTKRWVPQHKRSEEELRSQHFEFLRAEWVAAHPKEAGMAAAMMGTSILA